MPYLCTKTYGHDLGLSVCFRQPGAASHCSKLHGYALAFEFTFSCVELDDCNWVVDFGSLKKLKVDLIYMYDHKLLVAHNDPLRADLEHLGTIGAADVRVVEAIGMEAFAFAAFNLAVHCVRFHKADHRVLVDACRVWEHAGNSAIYLRRQ